jgi:hypothetical protein
MPEVSNRRSERMRVILILVILALTAVVGALAVGIYRSVELGARNPSDSDRMTIEWMPPESSLSLGEAQTRAEERAVAWSDDVELVRAEGAWHAKAETDILMSPLPIAWTFYYYSPSQQRLVFITVLDEGLKWVEPITLSTDPRSLGVFPPDVPPEAAWQMFTDAGGAAFLEGRGAAIVHFKLLVHSDRTVWRLSSMDELGYLRVTLDSQTGEQILLEE